MLCQGLTQAHQRMPPPTRPASLPSPRCLRALDVGEGGGRRGQRRLRLRLRLRPRGRLTDQERTAGGGDGSRANARLRMGDLVIEAGAFKVGASSKDAQALLREKLDQDGILADIAQIDNEVSSSCRHANACPRSLIKDHGRLAGRVMGGVLAAGYRGTTLSGAGLATILLLARVRCAGSLDERMLGCCSLVMDAADAWWRTWRRAGGDRRRNK